MANYIAEQINAARRRRDDAAARQRALALLALGSANPTDAELGAFRPGQAIDPLRNVTGATATPGPEGVPDPALAADLQTQLRNEELARASTANAPAVQNLRLTQALASSGLTEQTAVLPATVARTAAITNVLNNPDIDPLLAADIADKKPVFKPNLVIGKGKDGKAVWMHSTPTLTGAPQLTPALDEFGAPFGAPERTTGGVLAPGGVRPRQETALGWNVRTYGPSLFPDDPKDVQTKKAIEYFSSLKGKKPIDAWDSLTRDVAKMEGGRYSRRGPEALYQKVVEIWRVARPSEPIPADAPDASPSPSPSAAVPAPAAAKPAGAGTDAYSEARRAIARGADPDAVKARLKQMGHDPGKL